MKRLTPKGEGNQRAPLLFLVIFFFSASSVSAQCNVNDKYDKIISGYHSSIALKDNGTYCTWGSSMSSTGAADVLSPQDINSTNYSALTGTIYKAALGGKSAGAAVDQGILLTSTGLWAWGIVGNVLKSTIKSTAAFGRITSPSGGFGSTTLGLPTGIAPTDVQILFATYQTLIVLTKIVNNVGGDVYVLTQTSLAVEANGGTVTTAGSSSWQRVKTGASTYLTGVTAVRGQVYNTSNNAFIAVTSGGQLYTWGNTASLASGTAPAALNYATAMTLPTESASSITPAMIGVTGGGASGATTVLNTYYVLSTTGNLYSMGENSQKQCGDFTTTARTSWVQVKKSTTAGDYLTNIKSFSCQEHNASYPAVAAVTVSGQLYTWGNNSSGMLARSDNGAVGGNLTTTTFDPGLTAGVSGTVISVEMGGHTMVYLKEGSNQFCYAGHYTNGSMGDGGSGNNGSSAATTLLLNCATTPSISICGYVPVAASAVNSVISLSPTSIAADGVSTTTITIQLKDASNNNLTSSGGTVVVTSTAGTLGTVTDNGDGTYTVILTSGTSVATANIAYSINGTAGTNTTAANFISPLPLLWDEINAKRAGKLVNIDWTTEQEFQVSHFVVERSLDGKTWTTAADHVKATNGSGIQHYQITDNNYSPVVLYYRVGEIDLDGKITYSSIAIVAADNNTGKIIVYPVPAFSKFYLGNVSLPATIRTVQLFSINGALLKSWNGYQDNYDISNLSSGIYGIKITLKDGNSNIFKLDKIKN